MTRTQLDGLQIIRGLAATAVVLDHVSTMAAGAKYYGHPILADVFHAGLAGVDLFFCLSGFIVCYVALQPRTLAPRHSAVDFISRRFVRIVPFLWAVLAIYLALRLGQRTPFDPMPIVRAFAIYPLGALQPAQVWTLRHEALFYSIFAVTFLHRRGTWIALWCLSPLVFADAFASGTLGAFIFNRVNLLFGLGLIGGLAFQRWPSRLELHPAILLSACALVFACAHLLDYNRASTAQVLLIGVIGTGAVIAGAFTRAHGLVGRISLLLGNASYSIYLTHTIVVSLVLTAISHRVPRMPDAAILFGVSAIAIASGIALHLVLEKRIVAIARKALKGAETWIDRRRLATRMAAGATE